MTTWVLVLAIYTTDTSQLVVPGFQSLDACQKAGKAWRSALQSQANLDYFKTAAVCMEVQK